MAPAEPAWAHGRLPDRHWHERQINGIYQGMKAGIQEHIE